MSTPPTPKVATSFRLTIDAARLLGLLAARLGIPRTAVVEVAIRDLARRHKLD